MDNFIVSARKYRPATFDTVIGQDSITHTLKNSIKSNQLAHSYLFCGPRGVGKTTCARIFAKTINCLNTTDSIEACDKCDSCIAFNKSSSFNIHELDAASHNSVDDIRSLIEQVRIPPQVGKYSVYIIDEVHMLSMQAFNSFLKTLEEPPAHAIFILATTEKHKIIPTILSRCQIFDFNRISITDIVNHLKTVAENENVDADINGLNIIAQKADGALIDALSIFDQIVSFSGKSFTYNDVINNLNVIDYEYYFKFINYFLSNDIPSSLNLFNEILDKGFDGHHLINGISKHIRDLLVCKDNDTIVLLEVGDIIKENYIKQSHNCSVTFLFNALNILSKADINYKASNNKRLHVELTLLQLCNIEVKKENIQDKSSNKELEKKEIKKSNTEKVDDKKNIVKEPNNADGEYKPRTHSIKNAISNKSIEKKEIETEKIVEKENDIVENNKNPFSEQQLFDFWEKFALKFKNEETMRKYSLISTNIPKLLDDFKIELILATDIQKDVFNKEVRNEILVFLKNNLKNDFITINVIVKEKKEKKNKIYTDSDKYNHLKNINPDIDKLQQKFKLDFK